jgi:hypothetical protein
MVNSYTHTFNSKSPPSVSNIRSNIKINMVMYEQIELDMLPFASTCVEVGFPRRFTVRGDHAVKTCPPEEEL